MKLAALLVAPIVALTSAVAQDAYQRGAEMLRAGRISDAVAAFEEAMKTAPSDPRGWRGLGVAHASGGNYRLAAEPLRKACEMDPADPDGCYYQGLTGYNLGRYDIAIEAYRKALKTGIRIGRARTGLGLAYEAIGRSADAERELLEGMSKDDGKALPDFDPRVEYGGFLFRQGRLDEARVALLKARQDSPRAQFELGRIFAQEGQLDEAAARLTRAVSLDPSYAAAHLLLGRVYFRLGRATEGERHTALGQKLSASKP